MIIHHEFAESANMQTHSLTFNYTFPSTKSRLIDTIVVVASIESIHVNTLML